MMFPAAAPMLLLFHAVSSQRRARGATFVPTWVFAAGYLLVWIGVGAVAWVLVEAGSELAGRLSDAARETWGPLALGAVLLVAGLYQLTPLKRVCLDHCRTPLGFVNHHWRDGHFGSLRMGVLHGGYCLGCCWAMFAVLVAAGVMSLAWMLLLTLVVFAEKVLPIGRWGIACCWWGVPALRLLGCPRRDRSSVGCMTRNSKRASRDLSPRERPASAELDTRADPTRLVFRSVSSRLS
jgi:predicted metal-binding membrane protein